MGVSLKLLVVDHYKDSLLTNIYIYIILKTNTEESYKKQIIPFPNLILHAMGGIIKNNQKLKEFIRKTINYSGLY